MISDTLTCGWELPIFSIVRMLAMEIRDLETVFLMVNWDSNLDVPPRHSCKVKKCRSLDLTYRSTVQGILLNGEEPKVKLLNPNPHHYCPGQYCDQCCSCWFDFEVQNCLQKLQREPKGKNILHSGDKAPKPYVFQYLNCKVCFLLTWP